MENRVASITASQIFSDREIALLLFCQSHIFLKRKFLGKKKRRVKSAIRLVWRKIATEELYGPSCCITQVSSVTVFLQTWVPKIITKPLPTVATIPTASTASTSTKLSVTASDSIVKLRSWCPLTKVSCIWFAYPFDSVWDEINIPWRRLWFCES